MELGWPELRLQLPRPLEHEGNAPAIPIPRPGRVPVYTHECILRPHVTTPAPPPPLFAAASPVRTADGSGGTRPAAAQNCRGGGLCSPSQIGRAWRRLGGIGEVLGTWGAARPPLGIAGRSVGP
eukprot:scaffold34553_cov118-Isochrysis_galbana.AAC.1